MSFLVTSTKLCDLYLTERDVIERFIGSGLFTWGLGPSGSLGDNSSISKSSPVQTISTGLNWTRVCSSGTTGTVDQAGGIKLDGTLWLWGCNVAGALGNNDTITRSSPVQTVATGTNWCNLSLSSGSTFNGLSAGLKTDGTLWLWGVNNNGQLGNSSTINRSSPVQTVSTGTNWARVSSGHSHAVGLKNDGTLWTWGLNTQGQLGNNNATSQSSPVQTISTAVNWCTVAAHGCMSAGLKTDGTLWLWGINLGLLGNNNTIARSSPVQTVSTGTDWRQISINGVFNTQAIKVNGTLWSWGCNVSGGLGNNDTISRSSPVQTISTGTNWRTLASLNGGNVGGAIKTDGTLWLWGCNVSGGLGTNTTTNQSSPVQTVILGQNWKCASIGCTSSAVTNNF